MAPPGIHPDEDAIIALIERSVPAERQKAMFLVFGPLSPGWSALALAVDRR